MRYILYIVFILTCSSVYGQGWRDSLDMARDSYKNKEYTQALDYYEAAQKGAPDGVDLSDEMAQSAYKAREFDKAEEIYKQTSSSKQSRTAKSDNYHNIGNARMKKKDYDGAIEAYKESLRLNPNEDQTRYNLSEAIRQLKNKQKKENQGGSNDNQNDENNQGDQNKDNQNGNQGEQGGDNNNSNQSEGDSGDKNEGTLPNKSVERMLDKLMKDEAETKRKVSGTKGVNKTPNSGKDW